MSPGTTVWSSSTTCVALGVPPLSITSQLYHQSRSPAPICAIQGQTASGVASMVMAWVDVKMASGTILSAGSERCRSTAVARQVASAMTQWTQHLPVPMSWRGRCRMKGRGSRYPGGEPTSGRQHSRSPDGFSTSAPTRGRWTPDLLSTDVTARVARVRHGALQGQSQSGKATAKRTSTVTRSGAQRRQPAARRVWSGDTWSFIVVWHP